jgi:hypothetical protein
MIKFHTKFRENRLFGLKCNSDMQEASIVKPVLNGISRVQNIFPLKPGFRLIMVHYNN